MSEWNAFLEEELKDPEVRAEYEALEPEFAIVQAMIEARKSSGLTQKQISERAGIAQGDISKIENGNGNPSLRTLKRLASAMDMKLEVRFLPMDNQTGTGRRGA